MNQHAKVDIRHSTCPHDCPSACALDIEVIDGRSIGRVRGSKLQTYTAGVVCAKVARYAERIHHPDRLLHPMRRTGPKGSGQFARISWDEALDEIAARFDQAEHEFGAQSVWPYYYAGTMGLVMRDGINRLAHVKKYSRFYSTICANIARVGFSIGTGKIAGVDPREMGVSDLVVIWGTNPVNTQVNVMTHAMRARKERGAKIAADRCLQQRHDEAGRYQDHASSRVPMAPSPAASCTCCSARVTRTAPIWIATPIVPMNSRRIWRPARRNGPRKSRACRWRRSRHSRALSAKPNVPSSASAMALPAAATVRLRCMRRCAFPAVTGAWQYEGGGAFFNNAGIWKFNESIIEGHDAIDRTTRWLDQSKIGRILTGDAEALKGGGPVKAMLIQNTNPVTVAPEQALVRQGFAREDLFVAVHEQFMTETAAMADIVLPATMFIEHDDLYYGGGHQHISVGAKLIDPPGECRSNHEVLQGLGRRLNAVHPGFEMSPRELIDATLKKSGHGDIETLEADLWRDIQPDFRTSHYLDGFAHADKKFHFKADWANPPFGNPGLGPWAEMPSLPDHWSDHRGGRRKTSVPPRHLAVAQLSQFQFQRNAGIAGSRGQAFGDDAPGRRGGPFDRRWRRRDARQHAR